MEMKIKYQLNLIKSHIIRIMLRWRIFKIILKMGLSINNKYSNNKTILFTQIKNS